MTVKIDGNIQIKDGNIDLRTLKELNSQIDTNITNINKNKSGIEKLQNYSTNEVAIGKWIDGRTIYRKVISTTCDKLAAQLNALNMRTTTYITGWAKAIYNNWWSIPSSYTYETGYHIEVERDSNGKATVAFYNFFSNGPCVVIVEYTKN